MTITHDACYDLQARYNGPIPKWAYTDAVQPTRFPDATAEEIEAVIAEYEELVASSETKVARAKDNVRWAREHGATGLSVIIAGERLEIAERKLRERVRLRDAWVERKANAGDAK